MVTLDFAKITNFYMLPHLLFSEERWRRIDETRQQVKRATLQRAASCAQHATASWLYGAPYYVLLVVSVLGLKERCERRFDCASAAVKVVRSGFCLRALFFWQTGVESAFQHYTTSLLSTPLPSFLSIYFLLLLHHGSGTPKPWLR